MKKSKEQVKKDFEIFAEGVERLKELEKELNSLDTRDFLRDAAEIRSRLKNVSDIPSIEKKLKILKLKIKKKYNPKKSPSLIKKELHKIKEGEDNIQGKISRLRREFKEIGDIPKIERSIRQMREDFKEIDDIPKIEHGIEKIDRKVSKIEEIKKGKVDSGVGVIVDTGIDRFLSNLKLALSERVKGKEKGVEEALRTDLKERENLFKEKYSALVNDFERRKKELGFKLTEENKEKLEKKLRKEEAELKHKLDREKKIMGERYKVILRKHAHLELEKKKQEIKAKLDREYEERVKTIRNEEDEEKNSFEKRKKELERLKEMFEKEKQKFLWKSKREIERREKRLKEKREEFKNRFFRKKIDLKREFGKLKDKEEEKKNILQRAIEFFESRKARLMAEEKAKLIREEKQLREKYKQHELELKNSKNRYLFKKHEEVRKIHEDLAKEFNEKLHEELGKREKELREQIKNEYELKLQKKLEEHEEEMRKRKLDLEMEIEQKMKQVLK